MRPLPCKSHTTGGIHTRPLRLVKRNRDRRLVPIDSLHRRVTHLLALATARGRLGLGFLAVMLPETDIHVALNVSDVLENVVNDAFLDRPTKEVELADSGLLNGGRAVHLKTDALAAAKRIEQTLAIRLELALVMKVDHKRAGSGLTFIVCCCHRCKGIAHIELLGVIRYEPVNESQTDGRRSCKNR